MKVLILQVVLFIFVLASQATLPKIADHQVDQLSDSQAIEAELDNIRALPFGFRAVCDKLTLRISSDSSATFIIRDSHLCSIRSFSIVKEDRSLFTLCSNDPKHVPDNPNRSTVRCADLEFEPEGI